MAIDLSAAVEAAAYRALDVPAVTDHSKLTQHVLPETKPPLVVLADINLAPAGGKDGGLDRATVTVLTYVRAAARAALFSRMAANRDAIEDVALIAVGAALSAAVMEKQTDDLLEDGETYEGTQVFGLFVQAA